MRAIGQDELADIGKQNFSADILEMPEIDDEIKDEALNEVVKDDAIQDAEIVNEELFNKEEQAKKAESDVLDKLKNKSK
jgi:hypothetical protein